MLGQYKRVLLVIALFVWDCCTSIAQKVEFENQAIPPSTQPLIYKDPFFLYASEDLFGDQMSKGHRWWLPELDQPKIAIEDFSFTSIDSSEAVENYQSLQISLIDALSFEQINGDVCCPDRIQDECPEPHVLRNFTNGYTFTISDKNKTEAHRIMKTDAYYLILSNCDDKSNFTVTGKVIIKNSFGYLPGNLFRRMDFYYGLFLCFLVLWAFWVFIMVKEKANLIPFHYFVCIILSLGVLHTLIKFQYLKNWNISGHRNQFLLVFSILSYVILNCFSFVLILLASLGWGVTKPQLDHKTFRKIQVFIFIFIIVETARVAVSEVSKFSNASSIFIFILILPSTITYFVLVFWIFTSLMGLLSELEINRQYEKLQIFRRLLICLLLSVIVGIIIALIGNFIITMPIWRKWQYLWIFEDVTPFTLFLCVLSFLMILWRPNSKSKRLAYFIEIRGADEFDILDVWSDDFNFDESDDENLIKGRELPQYSDRNPHNTVAPFIIGRPSTALKSKAQVQPGMQEPSMELKSIHSTNDTKQA